MSHSVTTILRAGKDPKTLQIFEDTKHIWAPRGTHVHGCLELVSCRGRRWMSCWGPL